MVELGFRQGQIKILIYLMRTTVLISYVNVVAVSLLEIYKNAINSAEKHDLYA